MIEQLRRLAGGGARGFAAGLAGTAAMTATLKAEQVARDRAGAGATVHTAGTGDQPVDYDASNHVVTAAARVLHHTPSTRVGNRMLFLVVHWGYGSAVGIAYRVLLSSAGGSPARATVRFYVLCQAMAMTLFPVLGGTPPPWRWPRRIMISSLAQHAVYAAVVAAATEAVNRSGEQSPAG